MTPVTQTALPTRLSIQGLRDKNHAPAPSDLPVDGFKAGGHDQIDWCIPPCLGKDTDQVKSGGHDQIDWCIPPCLGSDTDQVKSGGHDQIDWCIPPCLGSDTDEVRSSQSGLLRF